MTKKIPVTVLTGFLGSGKTTLLNRILSEEHGLRIAVIENEFGEIGIDQDLVINADEEVFEMNNGCICCNVRGDLIRILGELSQRKDKFDRVVIETTGMADPGPVAQTFFVDETVNQDYEIDGIITLVDAKHVKAHLDKGTSEVLAQVAFADRIILNKQDMVAEGELQTLRARLEDINHMAGFYASTMADAPIAELLDIGGFNLDRAVELKPGFQKPTHHGHHHHHQDSVNSVSVEIPGVFDVQKINEWLKTFLLFNGDDVYRMKGVIGVEGQDCQFIFQGVHQVFGSQPGKPWGDQPPINRMVFIGKNLDEVFIRDSLQACLH